MKTCFPSASNRITARRIKGFGLLEVILVFAIVIGAAAVVFTVFQSAKPSADASQAVDEATLMVGNFQTTYPAPGYYANVGIPDAINAKVIPADLIASPTTMASQWGQMAVGQNNCNGIVGRCIEIVYAHVPNEVCLKFLSGVQAVISSDILVDGTTVYDPTTGHLSMATAVTRCGIASGGYAPGVQINLRTK